MAIDFPPQLRAAKAEYQRKHAKKEEITPELRALVDEYNRWSRYKGEPPPVKKRRHGLYDDKPYKEEYKILSILD